MKFEQALNQMVEQGAIRTMRMSAVWYIAYRYTEDAVEARALHEVGGDWRLADQLPSGLPSPAGDGWQVVNSMPQKAAIIESEAAKKNRGYYTGLTRQCYTCKKERPIMWFAESEGEEGQYRTWECKVCAGQRRREQQSHHLQEDEHLGDYMKDSHQSSRPPVPSEI